MPEWEQVASAACAGYAITLAAHALELGAVWKSAPFVDAPAVRACFELAVDEQLLGWINLGHPDPHESSRPPLDTRPDLSTYLAA